VQDRVCDLTADENPPATLDAVLGDVADLDLERRRVRGQVCKRLDGRLADSRDPGTPGLECPSLSATMLRTV
jgi:hypothetical protein